MSCSNFLDEIFQKLTGTTPPTSGDFWKPVTTVSELEGYKVIFSGDLIGDPSKVPDRAFPYIMFEVSGLSPCERKGFKVLELLVDIGVIGDKDARKEVIRATGVMAAWFSTTKFTEALGCYPDAVQFTTSDRGSKWIGARYSLITIKAYVRESW